jgi:hypothetical protein
MTIEEYLAELRRHLRVGPLAKRRILREIESHLAEAAAKRGENAAIAELGPPGALARRFEDEQGTSLRGRWTAGAGLAAVVATAVVVPVVVLTGGKGSHPPAPLGDGTIAALDANPARPEPVPASNIVASDQGYRVLSDSERTVWVARGRGRNSVCLVIEENSGLGAACASRTVLTRGPLYSASQRDGKSSISIVGLVDDAVTTVQAPGGETFQVRHNAFAFDGIPPNPRSIELKLFTAGGVRTFAIPTLKPSEHGPRQVGW